MPTSSPVHYPAQSLTLEGADALAFAQAQFSSNVPGLDIGRWQFSAWLDPRGRVRFFFHLARLGEERLVLLLRGGQAAAMSGALQRYVFRARVRISAQEPLALGSGPAMPLHRAQQADDPERLVLGCGDHSLLMGSAVEPDAGWRLRQIRARWPWLPDRALEQWLPPALGLDRLGATALDKGCYPGQEIVARLHYRGGHKRHLHRVQLSELLPPDSLLLQGDREFMRLLDVIPTGSGAEALAVVADELLPDEGVVNGLRAEPCNGNAAVQVTLGETPLSLARNDDSAE